MIDRKLILNDFDMISSALQKRNISKENIKDLSQVVLELKNMQTKIESKRALQNKTSKEYAKLMQNKENADSLKNELDKIKMELKNDEVILEEIESRFNNLMFQIPNLLDDRTPFGLSDEDNVEIKKVLTPKTFDFKPKEHWELAQQNGWIDFKSGVKLAKSRFSTLRGMGARLNQALISYMLDFNFKGGFDICSTPVIVNENMLFNTGQLPKFKDDMFKIENDKNIEDESSKGRDFYLISTSEITLTNLYSDEIIEFDKLPIKLTAHTPCFRKEAGSAHRDTRGMIRQHQFDKVEIVAITDNTTSVAMHEYMINHVSKLLTSLDLPHRLVQLCSGDIGFSSSNTVDIEVWLPGQNCYREISSISNCRDFQARRGKIRYKNPDSNDKGSKNLLAHTLNGSSLAVGRTLIAIMENFQDRNGEIRIPKVLEQYMIM